MNGVLIIMGYVLKKRKILLVMTAVIICFLAAAGLTVRVKAAEPTWTRSVTANSLASLNSAITNTPANTPTIITITQNINIGNSIIYIPENKIIRIMGTNANITITKNDVVSTPVSNNKQPVINIKDGGTLWLENIKITGGDTGVHNGTLISGNGGTFGMKNGAVITGIKGFGVINDGSNAVFEMKGGKIQNCTRGGVTNFGYAKFIMDGGEISENITTHEVCSGVHIEINCTFIMNGGKIINNSGYAGGGIINYGALIINGGEISGNKAEYGGGIANGEFGTVNITGNKSRVLIRNNTSVYDGGGIYFDKNYSDITNITVKNVSFSGNKAQYAYLGEPTAQDRATHDRNISASSLSVSGTRWAYNNYDISYPREFLDVTLIENCGTGYSRTKTIKVHKGEPFDAAINPKTDRDYLWGSPNVVFSHWSTTPNGSKYIPANLNGNLTLYAVWKKNPYTVKYIAAGAASIPDRINVGWDEKNLLPNNPVRTGYTFTGWNARGEGLRTTVSGVTNANKYSELAGNIDTTKTVTLTAQWKEKTYLVKYDLAGATGITKPPSSTATIPSSKTIGWGKSGVFPYQVYPVKTGFNFTGWEIEYTVNGRKYINLESSYPTNSGSYTIILGTLLNNNDNATNIIVRARWEAVQIKEWEVHIAAEISGGVKLRWSDEYIRAFSSTGGVTSINTGSRIPPRQLVLSDGTNVSFTTSFDENRYIIVSFALNPNTWTSDEILRRGFKDDPQTSDVIKSYKIRMLF